MGGARLELKGVEVGKGKAARGGGREGCRKTDRRRRPGALRAKGMGPTARQSNMRGQQEKTKRAAWDD